MQQRGKQEEKTKDPTGVFGHGRATFLGGARNG